jgi:ABC-type nitrate/sulfonate/bicarbonate transport system permease component
MPTLTRRVSAAARSGEGRDRRRRWTTGLLAVSGLVGLVACWEIAALIVAASSDHPDRVLPSLSRVLGTDLRDIATVGHEGAKPSYSGAFQVLWQDSRVTIARVLGGSAIGIVVGVGLGFAVALNDYVRRIVQPPVDVLRQFPLLALSILFLIWFGGASKGIYAFIAFGVGTMLFVNTVAAVRNVPPVQERFAATLGASRLRIIRTVVVPAVIPELMSGIKVAVGLAWAMALGAEYLGTQSGLGRRMLYFELFQFTGRMVVVAGLFVVWALVAHLLLTVLDNRLTRWLPGRG